MDIALRELREKATFMKFHLIKFHVNRLVEKETCKLKAKLDIKFDKLTSEKRLRDGTVNNPNDLIINLTGRQFSDVELETLKLGLKHGLAIRPHEDQMMVLSESIWDQISQNDICKGDLASISRAKTALKCFTYAYIDLDLKQFSKDAKRIKVIKNLRKECVILKPDKGTGVVVIKIEDYRKCLNQLFSDKNYFKKVDEDHMLTHLGTLQR